MSKDWLQKWRTSFETVCFHEMVHLAILLLVSKPEGNLGLNNLPQQLQYGVSLLVKAKFVASKGMVRNSRNQSTCSAVDPLITSTHSVYILAGASLLFCSIFSQILVKYYNISFPLFISLSVAVF